ncbi:MAG: putative membrane protein YdjX (TVP38/TMEM64 family) [Rhodothermales bacterium]|jgi:uncharacterized membrane protein YdjX (TVP38/TMEM64 family)
MSTRSRFAAFILLLTLAGGAALTLPLSEWALALVEWITGAGVVGVALYAVAYVVAALFMLPGSILGLAAGFAWGPVIGVLIVSPVSVVAATAAFLMGRFVARDWIAGKVKDTPRFAAIDSAVANDGFRVVVLLRLSPLFPFNLLNYALGLSPVRLRDYVLGSFLGMLPGTFLYVYVGSLVTSVSALMGGRRPVVGGWEQVLYWGGLVATVVVSVLITRMARRALRQYVPVDTSEA